VTPVVPNLALDDRRNLGVLDYLSNLNAKHLPPCVSPDAVKDPYISLGSHPDIVQRLWDTLAASLPHETRCIVFGTPALVVPRSGLVLAIGFGTQYGLRVPLDAVNAAVAAGAKTFMKWSVGPSTDIQQLFGADWVFGWWLKEETEWCRRVFDSAEGAGG